MRKKIKSIVLVCLLCGLLAAVLLYIFGNEKVLGTMGWTLAVIYYLAYIEKDYYLQKTFKQLDTTIQIAKNFRTLCKEMQLFLRSVITKKDKPPYF